MLQAFCCNWCIKMYIHFLLKQCKPKSYPDKDFHILKLCEYITWADTVLMTDLLYLSGLSGNLGCKELHKRLDSPQTLILLVTYGNFIGYQI